MRRTPTTINTLSIMLFSVLMIACKQDAGFKGNVASKPQPTVTQDAQPATVPDPTPTPTPHNPNCNENGITVVQLLSSTIANGAPGQVLQYKLSMKDCDGRQTPITADQILFDINAYVPQQVPMRNLTYSITAENTNALLASGVMQTVQGQDLFGVINPTHFYHRTNQAVSIPATMKAVNFSVDISGLVHHNIIYRGTRPPLVETIDTFLRFGNAAAVKQPVTFQNSANTP